MYELIYGYIFCHSVYSPGVAGLNQSLIRGLGDENQQYCGPLEFEFFWIMLIEIVGKVNMVSPVDTNGKYVGQYLESDFVQYESNFFLESPVYFCMWIRVWV